MSNPVYLTGNPQKQDFKNPETTVPEKLKSNVPQYQELQQQLTEANMLLDDVILKNYLSKLSELEIIPLADDMKHTSDIRLFKINEMVYQKDEYSTYKFASVFNAVQNLNCGIFIVADSDGQKTDFYMGVRSLDDKRTTKSLKETLRNALCGQFPGVKTTDLLDPEAETLFSRIPSGNIAMVSCVANNKNENFYENGKFIQGLEKLALAMQGQRYTVVVLAKSTPTEQISKIRCAYESIYTQLSPFSNMQLSYGTSQALNISNAFSRGTSIGTSHTTGTSTQIGENYSNSNTFTSTTSESESNKIKALGAGLLGAASVVIAPLTGGVSYAAAGILAAGSLLFHSVPTKSTAKANAEAKTYGTSYSKTDNVSNTRTQGSSESHTATEGITSTSSDNMQLTMQNKALINTLARIDKQLKRLDECESMGMWECAAYFLSDSQETAEMAAGTYKALMRGVQSGVETSALNCWNRSNMKEITLLRDYIVNFLHPVFAYRSEHTVVPLTPASLVSSNELAIHMGLPRKSVCGFPVVEHSDFGKEVVKYHVHNKAHEFILGTIFSMGSETNTEVRIDRDSLTMHTFVTGSTGSGKSNTLYKMIHELRAVFNVPFLVVEPAKGEYKNIFGQFPDVTVYGTNPKKFCNMLRINPFRFPSDIHVLEHLDRLIEIFNVCWPMYAAMPAILKDAMERAYVSAGWNLITSENPNGDIYPNFTDLLEEIENVIENSKYSSENKGDYSGALCTRIRSLTNGLNGLVFSGNDLTEAELFDRNVIVDLSRIGSTETKSLLMGLLIMKLNEYRMTSSKMNQKLSHITVLEEAHNLLKKAPTAQSSESANLLGKSVELLANSIAEMRTYGEGFIIVDQAPGLLDMSAIRNTNTKIILRLPEQSDRELVGYAAGLNKDQIQELSKLECGVAAVYQNDWVEPVLVKIEKCGIEEKIYNKQESDTQVYPTDLKLQLLNFLIQGRVDEHLDFDINEIEHNVIGIQLPVRNRKFIEEQIAEYKANKILTLWDKNNLEKLSRCVVDLLGIRTRIDDAVTLAATNDDLTTRLRKIVIEIVPHASNATINTLIHCFMEDFTLGSDEKETRANIYQKWLEFEYDRRS